MQFSADTAASSFPARRVDVQQRLTESNCCSGSTSGARKLPQPETFGGTSTSQLRISPLDSTKPPEFSRLRKSRQFLPQFFQHGTSCPHVPRREPPRPRQHCPSQLPSKASQGTSREPERVPAARDGAILLQSAIRRNSTTGRDYMSADYTAVSTVRPWTLQIGRYGD